MAWDCQKCGQHNEMDGFPCLRCERLADGKKPKKKKVRKWAWDLRAIFTGLICMVVAAGLAIFIVNKDNDHRSVAETCESASNVPGLEEGELATLPVPAPPGFESSTAKAKADTDIATVYTDSEDESIAVNKERINELARLDGAGFTHAVQITWKKGGKHATMLIRQFSSPSCAATYQREAKSAFKGWANRGSAEQFELTSPAGAIGAIPVNGDYANRTRVLLVKGGYSVLIDAPSRSAATAMANNVVPFLQG